KDRPQNQAKPSHADVPRAVHLRALMLDDVAARTVVQDQCHFCCVSRATRFAAGRLWGTRSAAAQGRQEIRSRAEVARQSDENESRDERRAAMALAQPPKRWPSPTPISRLANGWSQQLLFFERHESRSSRCPASRRRASGKRRGGGPRSGA